MSVVSMARTFTCLLLICWGRRTLHQHRNYQPQCLEHTRAKQGLKVLGAWSVEQDFRSVASLMMQKRNFTEPDMNSASCEASTLTRCSGLLEADCWLSPMPSAAHCLCISMPEFKLFRADIIKFHFILSHSPTYCLIFMLLCLKI